MHLDDRGNDCAPNLKGVPKLNYLGQFFYPVWFLMIYLKLTWRNVNSSKAYRKYIQCINLETYDFSHSVNGGSVVSKLLDDDQNY